ncbi:hypothetical protein J6590_044371 [Homalodisca vitripennis]|nr:hypothetical protein J6590_044371 [Homalodisca vitripennis]
MIVKYSYSDRHVVSLSGIQPAVPVELSPMNKDQTLYHGFSDKVLLLPRFEILTSPGIFVQHVSALEN